MKPEGKIVNGPETFERWLPDAVRDWCLEAKEAGKDISFVFEHRAVGNFEFRIKAVPLGQREMDLPPIQVVR